MQLPQNRKERNAVVLTIQRAIIATFDRSDWKELGYRTGTEDEIMSHHRLLRSLDWDDSDYPANVLFGIEAVLAGDKDGLEEIFRTEKIADWFRENEPKLYLAYVPERRRIAVASPLPAITTATVERALNDAETLLKTSGASSALDRVHTAFHGYLMALCDDAGISYSPEPKMTELFKNLRLDHPKLQASGPRARELTQIMNAFASVVDVVNTLRNKASVAHPNAHLLEDPEAGLVINATRTLLHYLDVRLR
jgi:hypothetical protein